MNLTPYVDRVRAGLTDAAALADDHTRNVAEQLGAALEPATRLALTAALSDAAASISADLAPASVELRLSGNEPEFVVSVPDNREEPTVLRPPSPPGPAEEEGDLAEEEGMVRITLRLPASWKAKVDEVADAEGRSTNAWLTGVIGDALGGRRGHTPPPPPPPPFAGGVFGPHGPFGPHGVFGRGGLFGGGAVAHSEVHVEEPEPGRRRGRDRGQPGGGVQGWVR
ncbi:MAG: hypothetical protein ACLGIF_10350 [Actinomycetes bacterium]